ncbi:CHASE3 domain-containing protein, partial [Clostridium butyricum]
MYSTNHSISSKMQNNDMLRAKISSLDQFKESIIDMAIMSKYYLITGDQYYKTEFEKNYNTASDNINDLYNSEYITISEKSNFLNNLNSYKEIAEDNSYIVNSDNIDPSLKK